MVRRAVPLIEVPETVDVARILADEKANERLAAYEEFRKGFSNERAREVLGVLGINVQTGEVEGMNLFSAIGLSQVAPEGVRIAGLRDWGRIAKLEEGLDEGDEHFFEGIYTIAPEICLRTRGDSFGDNDYVAKDLAKKLRKRAFRDPIVVRGLKLEEDGNSSYGLVLTLKDAEVIQAPALAYKGSSTFRFSEQDENGIPVPDEDGVFTCYVRENGLSRFFRIRRVLDSSYWGLADFDRNGRVVEVSAEGATQNFGKYAAKILKARDAVNSRASEIVDEAVSKLKGLAK